MNKHILHSVLETLTVDQTINICFAEPFSGLSGDYTVLASKVGRGRGGSRVIEIRSVANPAESFGALEIEGKQRALGTGTSDFISTITIDGKVHGLEDPAESNRPRVARATDGTPVTKRQAQTNQRTAGSAAIGQKVASALGQVLSENPDTCFKLTGRTAESPMTGEWRVTSFVHENGVLRMECVDMNAPERTLSFDSSVDGPNLKDAEAILAS